MIFLHSFEITIQVKSMLQINVELHKHICFHVKSLIWNLTLQKLLFSPNKNKSDTIRHFMDYENIQSNLGVKQEED